MTALSVCDFNNKMCSYVGGYRKVSDVKWIVVHYTGSVNCGSYSMIKFFNSNPKCESSTHFVIDREGCYNVLPVNRIAYHCGSGEPDSSYKKAYYYKAKLNREAWGSSHPCNKNSIGVDLCCGKVSTFTKSAEDNDWYIERDTYMRAVYLVGELCKEYNIPIDHVVRHADVTGKPCPRPWVSIPSDGDDLNDIKWNEFKKSVEYYKESK